MNITVTTNSNNMQRILVAPAATNVTYLNRAQRRELRRSAKRSAKRARR